MCVELMTELTIKEKEVLVKSGEAEDTTSLIREKKEERENIRANRLLRYQEMAKKDEEFQAATTASLNVLINTIQSNERHMESFLNILSQYLITQTEK